MLIVLLTYLVHGDFNCTGSVCSRRDIGVVVESDCIALKIVSIFKLP